MDKFNVKDFQKWSSEDRVRYLRYLKFEGVREPELEKLLTQSEQIEMLKTPVPSLANKGRLDVFGKFEDLSEKKKESLLKSIKMSSTNPYGPFVPGQKENKEFSKEEETKEEKERMEIRKAVFQDIETEEETWLSLWMKYDGLMLSKVLFEFLPMAIRKKWNKCFKADEEDEELQRCIYKELKSMKKDNFFQGASQFLKSVEEYKQIYDKYHGYEVPLFLTLFYDSNNKNKLFQKWKDRWSPSMMDFTTMMYATKRFNFKKEFWQKLEKDTDEVVSVMNQLKRMDGKIEIDMIGDYVRKLGEWITLKYENDSEIKDWKQELLETKDEKKKETLRNQIRDNEAMNQELQEQLPILKEEFPKQMDVLIETFRRGIEFVKVSPQMVQTFQETFDGLRNLKKSQFDVQAIIDALDTFVIRIKKSSRQVQSEVRSILEQIFGETETENENDIEFGYSISAMTEIVADAISSKRNVKGATDVLLESFLPNVKSIADRIYFVNYLKTLETPIQRKLFVLLTVGTKFEIDTNFRNGGWEFITKDILGMVANTENPRQILNQIAEDVNTFDIMIKDYFVNPGRIKDVVALTKKIVQDVFKFKRNKEIQKVLSLQQLGLYLLDSILKNKPEDESVKPKLNQLNEKLRETFKRRGGSLSDTVAALGAQVLKSKMKDLAAWLNQKKPQIVMAVNQALNQIIPFATISDPAEKILPVLYVVQPELLAIKSVSLGETVMKAIINYAVKQALSNLKDLPNYVNSVLTTVIQKLNDGDIDGLKRMISF